MLAQAAARERFARKNEAEDLRRAFDILDTKGDGRIDADEVEQVFKQLGHKCKRADIEDMIWEVDDDCDKHVTWAEFQAMFSRCRNDKTGYEPRRLYNVAEFLMNDKDKGGSVSVEEVMQILFLRYGRQLLDSQLEEIFGTSDTNSGTRDLSLTEFLTSLNMSQAKQLRAKAAATSIRSTVKPAATGVRAPVAAAPKRAASKP